jgi:DNA-binding response OmpR family regulator
MAEGESDVLVVEDDPELNELVGAYVQIAGYEYRPAGDGAAAIRLARERQPALIVLDVMLPDIDGFEVCRRLKDDEQTRRIPIVMLTALDREEHRARGRACGAVGYLTKPFDPDQLLKAIRENASRNGQGK